MDHDFSRVTLLGFSCIDYRELLLNKTIRVLCGASKMLVQGMCLIL
jgi:hypothetical protein